MTLLTIIIPVGPAHEHIFHEAVQSAEAQTVPCEIIVIHDRNGKGAGHARNRGLEQVQTEFVTFLDADDVIDPHFAEICLGILGQYRAAGNTDARYLYTDWYGVGNQRHIAPSPCDAWTNNTAHLVTAVVPTDRARLIGGFDEVMTGVEDADFYVRLRLSGVCGLHVEAPLVSYREGGQRSVTARASGAELAAKQYMTQRYGRYAMGCCGDTAQGPTGPSNQPQSGDVLAQAQWQGNRQERGRATGRLYERTSFPKTVYVSPDDIAAAPQHWKRVANTAQAATGVVLQPQYAPVSDWQHMANAVFGGGTPAQPAGQSIEYKPNRTQRDKAQTVKGMQS